jgi:hypothetical protein
MEKYTPYEKLSKKKKRELNARRRGSWGGLKPITRRPENPKAYDRKKARKRGDDSAAGPSFRPAPPCYLPRLRDILSSSTVRE